MGTARGTVRSGNGAVPVGLVEVHEDSGSAFFLPPGGGDLLRHAALQLASGSDHRVPDVKELVLGVDRRVHMESAVAGGFDERGEAGFCQHGTEFLCRRDGVVEVRTRLRIQVDPELVRIIGIVGPRRPGVEHHRIHLCGPYCGRRLVDHQLGMRPRAGVRHGYGTDILRGALGRILREEHLAFNVPRVSLEADRTVSVGSDKSLADLNEVVGKVQLGQSHLRPHHPAWTRNPDLAWALGPGTVTVVASLAMATSYPVLALRVRHRAVFAVGGQ